MKLLVIKPSSLGDVIHALPFLSAVKKAFPHSSIDWVISRNLSEILEDHPLINSVIALDKDSWKRAGRLPATVREVISLAGRLRTGHYDAVVDLQGLLRSGIMARFPQARERIGFSHAREGSRIFYTRSIAVNGATHAVDQCLEAARALGAGTETPEFRLDVNKEARGKVRHLLGGIQEYAVIIPSARWESKRWPAEHFGALISRMPLTSVIAGSSEDRDMAENILKTASAVPLPEDGPTGPVAEGHPGKTPVINLCGRTGLKELVALIKGARIVVSNDSGPMHIAAAMNVPTVALFGPTDPVRTGPYGWQKDKRMRVLRAGADCAPCRRKTCHEECMSHISVESVLAAVKELL